MRNISLFTAALFGLGIVGCSDPARPHLERLVNDWGVVVATGYTHSDTYTQDEQRVHTFHEQNTAMSKMLAEFLKDDLPVSNELKSFLRDWKKVTDESALLHKKMIDEGRFTYTVAEKARVDTLFRADMAAAFEMTEHFKGY